MAVTPIVNRASRSKENQINFSFTKEMIPDTGSTAFRKFMESSWQVFEDLPYPTGNEEAWRRTNLKKLNTQKIIKNNNVTGSGLIPERLNVSHNTANLAGQLILQPGGKTIDLDEKYKKMGVILDDISQVARDNPDLVMNIVGKYVKPGDGKYSALASAFGDHGLFLYVPKNVKITQPISSLFCNSGDYSAAFSHHIIWLEENSEATLVQEFSSYDEDNTTQFHAGVIEVALEAESKLNFVEFQTWGNGVWNIMHEKINVQQDASLSWIFGSMGSKLTKSFSSVDLAGKGATAKVSGFYFADSDQHFDMDTEQNHLAMSTTSDLLYKGAVTDNARSIWQGNIYVAPGADGTDGYQSNRNLILSRQARADSIPGLEILADDVKCTHGATVGKVDPEQIFYLRSRGLSETEAKHLIVEGFFETIMDRIPFNDVQERFRGAIIKKIGYQNASK